MVNFASAYTHVHENHETLCHIVHDPKTMRKTKTGWLTVNIQGKEINEMNLIIKNISLKQAPITHLALA